MFKYYLFFFFRKLERKWVGISKLMEEIRNVIFIKIVDKNYMLFYLFGVTGIHEQYYIFYRVKPLYHFQNPNHTLDIYFNICKNIQWPLKYKNMCCIVKINTSLWENVTPYFM